MSFCQIVIFRNNKPDEFHKFNNSSGGVNYIWDRVYEQFLQDPQNQFDHWIINNFTLQKLCELPKRGDVPLFMKAVHVSTYDNAIIEQKNLRKFVNHLREFLQFFGKNDKVCHLHAWANLIEQNLDAQAIGFHVTSTSENPWIIGTDENNGELIYYDLGSGKKHFEVYQNLVHSIQ